LWVAYGVSEFGTALSMGALPLIAVVALGEPDLLVSLLAALAGLGAALAVPLGPWIEFRRKRPVLVGADLLRFAALVSVPVAAAAGALTYAQLCVVAVLGTVGAIAFNAASGAHLKALVPAAERTAATGRLEATFWTANTVGPPLGGLLIALLGPTATLGADAVTFLLSALGVRRLRAPEPAPPVRVAGGRGAALAAGWRHIWAHRQLRALFLNAQVFGCCIIATLPLLAVRMLRDLGFGPWQYGLVLGLPCAGGILGAALARPLSRRIGPHRILPWFGTGRALWLCLLPLAPGGAAGLAMLIVTQSMLLVCVGTFNPIFVAYRLEVTADGHLSRVIAAWGITSRLTQPAMTAVGGLLAALVGARGALAVLAAAALTSIPLLPWRAPAPAAAVEPAAAAAA
jgi:MFS family permease